MEGFSILTWTLWKFFSLAKYNLEKKKIKITKEKTVTALEKGSLLLEVIVFSFLIS